MSHFFFLSLQDFESVLKIDHVPLIIYTRFSDNVKSGSTNCPPKYLTVAGTDCKDFLLSKIRNRIMVV